jgi:hypothetical protein
LSHFYIFTIILPDRLGTNIGKTQKTRTVFPQVAMTFFENFEAEETARLLADPHKSFNSAR